jgi:hypothetical protein
MTATATKLRSIWTAAVGDKVLSKTAKHYNQRGEIIAFLSGSRAEVRLYNGTTATIVLPDLELI